MWSLPGQALGTVNGAEILQQTTLGGDLGLVMTKCDIKILTEAEYEIDPSNNPHKSHFL